MILNFMRKNKKNAINGEIGKNKKKQRWLDAILLKLKPFFLIEMAFSIGRKFVVMSAFLGFDQVAIEADIHDTIISEVC